MSKHSLKTLRIGWADWMKIQSVSQPVKPDDHSEVVPLLPIPNRKVKCLSADDSAGSRVKVGHRQAINVETPGSDGRAFCSEFADVSASSQ